MEILSAFEESCLAMPWKRRRVSDLESICDDAACRASGRCSDTAAAIASTSAARMQKGDRTLIALLASALAASETLPVAAAVYGLGTTARTLCKADFLQRLRSLAGHFQREVRQRRAVHALERHMPVTLTLRARTAASQAPHLLFGSTHADRLPVLLRPLLPSHVGVDVVVVPWLLEDRMCQWRKAGFAPRPCPNEEAASRRLPKVPCTRFLTPSQLLIASTLLQDLVVCDDIRSLSVRQKRALGTRRCRSLVIGGWKHGELRHALVAALPYAKEWSARRVLRLVRVAFEFPPAETSVVWPIRVCSGARAKIPSGSWERLVCVLVESLLALYINGDVAFATAQAHWLSLRDARALALQEELDSRSRNTALLVVDWCTRVVTRDVVLAAANASSSWRDLFRVWGDDASRVCPRCALVSCAESHACVWGGEDVFLAEMEHCDLLQYRLAHGLANRDRNTLFRRLSYKQSRLRGATQLSTEEARVEWNSALLTLRCWHVTEARRGVDWFEDAAGAVRTLAEATPFARETAMTCALVVTGASTFRHCYGRDSPVTGSLPHRGAAPSVWEPVRPMLTGESLPLWLLMKHVRRGSGLLWALEEQWRRLCDLLGTRWVVFGGPTLLDAWSFREDVRSVVLLPSFFLGADPRRRCRKAREAWPNAVLSCYAPVNSPCLVALRRLSAGLAAEAPSWAEPSRLAM